MWFDGQRQPNTLYVANTSRGKDSTAMLRAIQLMGWPLDMICSVDIWFDEDTPAELPPMVKFKDEYDAKILEWFGIPVTRLCATKRSQTVNVERERAGRARRLSYCDIFYTEAETERHGRHIYGFPCTRFGWCKRLKDTANTNNRDHFEADIQGYFLPQGYAEIGGGEKQSSDFRTSPRLSAQADSKRMCLRIPDYGGRQGQLVYMAQAETVKGFPLTHQRGGLWCQDRLKDFSGKTAQTVRTSPLALPVSDGRKINIVHYIGIAADEPKRIAKHIDKPDKVLPLVQIGWDEALCGLEAQYMDMLSPTYSDGQLRDGCWFCHNQGVGQLRRLRKNYPDLWAKLMKLDLDSPVTFHPDGHTVHDFDRRFQLEDEGLIDPSKRFWWKMLDDDLQYMMNL